MKNFKILLSIICFMFCLVSVSQVQAANWQIIEDSKGGKLELNADNITRANGVYTAWIRFQFADDKQEVYNGQKIAMRMEKLNFRTTENGDEFKCLEIYEYSKTGELLNEVNGDEPWSSVIPGTIGETIYNKVLEIRKTADENEDKKAKSKQRAKENKENIKNAANIAGAVLGGLF